MFSWWSADNISNWVSASVTQSKLRPLFCCRKSTYSVWGQTSCHTTDEGSKVINSYWVKSHASAFPNNIYALTYLFVTSDFQTYILSQRKFWFWITFVQKCFQATVIFGNLFRMAAINPRKCFHSLGKKKSLFTIMVTTHAHFSRMDRN